MSTILVADDDHDLLKPVCRYIAGRDSGLKTLAASSGAEGIDILRSEQVDVVLSDLRMPDGDGIDILAYLSSRVPPIPVVVMSGYIHSEAAETLSRFGRLRFLSKPARLEQIFEVVQDALGHTEELGAFNGFSLAGVLQLVELEAKTCTVEVRNRQGLSGCYVFDGGGLQAALRGDTSGLEAALEMLSWEGPEVLVRGSTGPTMELPPMDCDITGLLMRSMQLRDESQAESAADPSDPGFALAEDDILLPRKQDGRDAVRSRPAPEVLECGTVLAVGSLLVAAQALAGMVEGGGHYAWIRNVALVLVYTLLVTRAFKEGKGQGALCLLFPPYLLSYVPRHVKSPLLRGTFYAVLLALVAEVFLLPERAALPAMVNQIKVLAGW